MTPFLHTCVMEERTGYVTGPSLVLFYSLSILSIVLMINPI